MTNEQREAIDRLSSLLKKGKYGVAGKTLLYEDYYMLKNVLEVVENQERKIIKQQEKIEKRDKIIDLMANSILTREIGKNSCQFNKTCTKFEKGRDIHCKDCIKQYYEKEVE